MNLVVDYGNSRIKAGLFQKSDLVQYASFEASSELYNWLGDRSFDNILISSVSHDVEDLLLGIKCTGKKIVMNQSIALPIKINYLTPHSLGVDRIAGACGAIEMFPEKDCLVIDMGTCINYEFVDASANYFGGAISPGVKMRFDAMHTFTARLPLVNPVADAPLIGDSTAACMQSGVINGVLAEVEGIIKRYIEKYPAMGVILCGGDASLFENKLKHPIFVAPNLVLCGLNRILLHNVDSNI